MNIILYTNKLTCGSQTTSISGNIIGKYNAPHARLPRATFSHQQNLNKEEILKKWFKKQSSHQKRRFQQ